MRLTLLAGGHAARLALDLAEALGTGDTLTVVAPTARDQWAHGLKRSPDLDALLVPAGEAAPTHGVGDALEALGFAPPWWRASDAQVARQVVRTELLAAGYSLTDATAALAARLGLPYTLLPASDDRNELHAVVEEEGADGAGRRAVHVEEVLATPHLLSRVVATTLVARQWSLTEQAGTALREADVVVVATGSRRLALEPLLAVPGLVLAGRPVLTTAAASEPEPQLPALAGVGDLPEAPAAGDDAAAVLAAARSLLGTGS